MDTNLKALIKSHPRLFRGKSPIVASWVEPGWYSIVETLCTDVELLLSDEHAAAFEVMQIKEKLGGLRFYFRSRASGGHISDDEWNEKQASSDGREGTDFVGLRNRIFAECWPTAGLAYRVDVSAGFLPSTLVSQESQMLRWEVTEVSRRPAVDWRCGSPTDCKAPLPFLLTN